MDIFLDNKANLWLLIGVLAILFDLIVGTFFAGLIMGLGALTVGALILIGGIEGENILLQMVVFCASILIWTLLLYKPLKGMVADNYNDLVGKEVRVISDFDSDNHGLVKYCGSEFQARISKKCQKKIANGDYAIIKGVLGSKLIITKR